MKKEDIKVSIGLPVYNNEKTIAKTLESLMNQSYKNFELIISDDASKDKTFDICSTYQKQDVRIKCFRQEKNLGFWKNWFFVLERAKGEYFMWAEGDDVWLEDFIEKNFQFLESNSKYVGSIGKIKFFDERGKEILNKISPNFVKNFTNHDLQTKINYYLRKMETADLLFALYRTSELKKCIIKNPSFETERCVLLKIMKFGDVNVLDEILLHRHMIGMSEKMSPMDKTQVSILAEKLFIAKNSLLFRGSEDQNSIEVVKDSICDSFDEAAIFVEMAHQILGTK